MLEISSSYNITPYTSSINIILGACSLASLNNSEISFSDSPIHLDTKSAEDTPKNVESASVATA